MRLYLHYEKLYIDEIRANKNYKRYNFEKKINKNNVEII